MNFLWTLKANQTTQQTNATLRVFATPFCGHSNKINQHNKQMRAYYCKYKIKIIIFVLMIKKHDKIYKS